MRRLRQTSILIATVPLLLAVAACSTTGSGASAPAGGGDASAAPSSGGKGPDYDDGSGVGSSPSAAPSDAAGAALVVGSGTGALGTFLTGPSGMTLYIFTKDSENTSVCSGDCASAWPPLLVDAGQAVTAGDGVPGALSTFARDDGSMQVAYDGKPLYYFAADKAAGDTTGQGVNDVWFIVEP
jgi:predicted lipoprotein with Yx(FWY)xxD motif